MRRRRLLPSLLILVVAAPAFVLAGAPEFVLSWGNSGSGDQLLIFPHDVFTGPSGHVVLLDHYRVKTYDESGVLLSSWGSIGTNSGDLNEPSGLTVDADGDVLVADTNNNAIKRFSATGQIKAAWTGGTGLDALFHPQDVVTGPDHLVYVTEPLRSRIRVLTYGGVPVRSWKTDDLDASEPMSLALAGDGTLYVGVEGIGKIQHYDPEGTLLDEFGSRGSGDGQFLSAAGLAVTDDAVYVVDAQLDRVTVYSRGGAFLYHFGTGGTKDGEFSQPEGVALASDGAVFVVDTGNRRVQKFAAAVAARPITWGALKHGDR